MFFNRSKKKEKRTNTKKNKAVKQLQILQDSQEKNQNSMADETRGVGGCTAPPPYFFLSLVSRSQLGDVSRKLYHLI